MQHGDAGRRAWRENDLTTSLDAQSARGSGRRARQVLGRGRAGGRAGGRAAPRPARPACNGPQPQRKPRGSPRRCHAGSRRSRVGALRSDGAVREASRASGRVDSSHPTAERGEAPWGGELCAPRGRSPSRRAPRTPRPPPTSPRPRARPRRAGLL